MVQARLNAFPSDFHYDGRFPIDLGAAPAATPPMFNSPMTEVRDARPLQAAAASPAAFFERYGFVLLQHDTQVRDWDRDVQSVYAGEVETLIREQLLPGRGVAMSPGASLARRGRGTDNDYAGGVHQDCGLSVEDYQQLVGAFASEDAARGWRYGYDRDGVEGFMMLDFWRPTQMSEALRHMPLTVCDPESVAIEDIVPTEVSGIAARGVHQMCVRANPSQLWYYYPGMTTGEVLVFKLYDNRKSDAEPRLRSCFHTAFADPGTPDDAEPRQSCEYRVGLYLLKA